MLSFVLFQIAGRETGKLRVKELKMILDLTLNVILSDALT